MTRPKTTLVDVEGLTVDLTASAWFVLPCNLSGEYSVHCFKYGDETCQCGEVKQSCQ